MGGVGAANEKSGAALRSPVSWALLGLVIQRPSYGYELVQRFERTYGHALELSSPSQIYTALDALERRGLIEKLPPGEAPEVVRQPKPHYRATARGVEQLRRLADRPGPRRAPPLAPVRAAAGRARTAGGARDHRALRAGVPAGGERSDVDRREARKRRDRRERGRRGRASASWPRACCARSSACRCRHAWPGSSYARHELTALATEQARQAMSLLELERVGTAPSPAARMSARPARRDARARRRRTGRDLGPAPLAGARRCCASPPGSSRPTRGVVRFAGRDAGRPRRRRARRRDRLLPRALGGGDARERARRAADRPARARRPLRRARRARCAALERVGAAALRARARCTSSTPPRPCASRSRARSRWSPRCS